MIRNYSFFILICFSFSSFFGQSIQKSNEINSSFPTCGFDYLRSILLEDSNYLRKEIDSEQKIAQYILQSQLRSSSSIYTIPIVVHVLHLGETVGVGTNISDAQIQSAITNLNDVYRGQTAGSPVDFEIEFALAQQDPNCVAHSGINRINASSVPNYSTGGVDYYGDGGEADETILKDLSRWPETEYFNIWIVSEIEDNNGGFGIQGYANFFTGSAYEGSVMMATVFGFDPTNTQPSFNLNSPRDNSTVVHEIGHYLHLHHTFKGDGDADDDGIGDACPGDVTIGVDSDGCADTEPHKRYTSQCKSGLLNDCTGATFGDNTAKNFMSYASCQDRLTADQKTRSRAMLATTGISLIYSKGDEAPVNYSTVIANANCSPQTSPLGLSGAYTGIKNFTIDGIFTNTSSWSDIDGGYVDNTLNCQKLINVFEGNSYNFEVSTLYNANNIKGYIDYNNDGNFLDANELIFDINTADNMSGDYVSSAAVNITIPTSNGTSIVSGTKLRLRLNSDIGIVANACEAPQYGQVEDYTIIINELVLNLTADFSASDSTFCQGTSITFTDLSTGTPTSWAWDFGDGNTSSLQNPTHTYASVGTYNVSLTVTTNTGSGSETKTGFIKVNSNPNINAGIDQTICDGSSTTLNATSGQNYVTDVTAVGASDYILSGAFSGN
ncbi:MAG: PKD domain-containing protein, partial [Flavobacteriales bacterium]|nr:PKD domain-containing protein [Flavobacteriales bacterium]